MTIKNFKKINFRKGFTMLEMTVALGVFSVIMLTFSSSFLILLDAERKAVMLVNVQDNLRFALEVMAKEIRTGTSYSSGREVDSFRFTNADGKTVDYRFNDQCRDIVGYRCIEKRIDDGDFLSLTSDKIRIEGLRFYVSGEQSGDGQPLVTITIQATTHARGVASKLNLQTTVSQRERDSS